MNRRNAIALIAQLFLSLCLSGVVESQKATRDNYYDYLPPFPKIVGQSEASVQLKIFGDASAADYHDRDPADGIDDFRAHRLLEIAERFSPILRRNNFVVPLHYLDATFNRPVLLVDTWRDGVRVHSDSVDLRLREDPDAHRASGDSTPSEGAMDDVKLEALIRELHPQRVEPVFVPLTPEVEKIIFFDLPGVDETTWRAAYAKLDRRRSKIHAHFLIHEPEGATGDERYELAVQFWFFYPFNDAANNHEGDWEHISVSIATKERGTRPNRAAETAGLLSSDEIGRILDNRDASIVDSLIHLEGGLLLPSSRHDVELLHGFSAPRIHRTRDSSSWSRHVGGPDIRQ